MVFSRLLSSPHRREFYEQALAFVLELREQMHHSGIQTHPLPPKTQGLLPQFVGSAPPDPHADITLVQTVFLRKTLRKSIRDYLNGELKHIADEGTINWDDNMFRKGHIGIQEDEDKFTGISLPDMPRTSMLHRGDIATAINGLESAINTKLKSLEEEKKPRR